MSMYMEISECAMDMCPPASVIVVDRSAWSICQRPLDAGIDVMCIRNKQAGHAYFDSTIPLRISMQLYSICYKSTA